MATTTKNVVILLGPGAKDPEPAEIVEWSRTATPGLRVLMAHNADEVAAQGVAPSEVDALVPWSVFREGVEPFMAACGPAKRLRWVHCTFAGIDRMLFPALVDDDAVTLTLTKDVYSSSLGEWVLLGLMYWEKFVPRLQAQQRAHVWERFYNEELRGKRMCVVGFGSIGQDAARKATALGVHVVGVRRRPVPAGEETTTVPAAVAERVVGAEQLLAVLPACDYVVLVMPLTPETRGCFTRAHFAAMKRSAIFVNIGRGRTVDHDALYDALREHRIAAASIDVAADEPLPPTSPLWDLDNILISPHGADFTPAAPKDCAALVKENLLRFARDEPLLNHADKHLGY